MYTAMDVYRITPTSKFASQRNEVAVTYRESEENRAHIITINFHCALIPLLVRGQLRYFRMLADQVSIVYAFSER